MFNNRLIKWLAFILSLIALTTVIGISLYNEKNSCMSVTFKSADELSQYTEEITYDFSSKILYNGKAVPVDLSTSTIYIAQNITKDTTANDLSGKLETTMPGHYLYFEECENFNNLDSTVKAGKSLKLKVVNTAGQYIDFNVVFTTLPVIEITGTSSYKNSKDRDVYEGDMTLWCPNDPELGRYSVKTSKLEWNVRGATSALLGKKPYKLSLKDKKGGTKDLSLMSLGEDDDWILNPMNTDRLYIREKFILDLWNGSMANEEHNTDMSRGEYVEVIINGQYSGLHLLQRRVDKKYLDLDDNDILLKGRYTTSAEVPEDAYEIDYSPYDPNETFEKISALSLPAGEEIMNINNFIDVCLFIQFGAMRDNNGYKNTFYTVSFSNNTPSLTLTLWDTDISFGKDYNDWFEYNYDNMVTLIRNRCEYDYMLAKYPDLERKMAERWFELRKSVFTEMNIFNTIDSNRTVIVNSGALLREKTVWNGLHQNSDTIENLNKFITERLSFLDDYYKDFLN